MAIIGTNTNNQLIVFYNIYYTKKNTYTHSYTHRRMRSKFKHNPSPTNTFSSENSTHCSPINLAKFNQQDTR